MWGVNEPLNEILRCWPVFKDTSTLWHGGMLYFRKWAAVYTISEGGAWFSLLCAKQLQSKMVICCCHNIAVASTRRPSGVISVYRMCTKFCLVASYLLLELVSWELPLMIWYLRLMHTENLTHTTVISWAVLLMFQWGHMQAKQICFTVL